MIIKKNLHLTFYIFTLRYIYMGTVRVRTNRFTLFYTGDHEVLVTDLSDHTKVQCKKNSIVIVGRNVRVSFATKNFYLDILKSAIFFNHSQIITLKKILSLTYDFSGMKELSLIKEMHNVQKIININSNTNINIIFNKMASAESPHDLFLYFMLLCKESDIQSLIFPLILYSAQTTFCNKVIDKLEVNISKRWTLRELSEEFNLSEIAIRKKLESEGVVFRELILEIRMKKAFSLLVEGEAIAKISNKVGYNNTSYFISHFKNFFGITPKQFQVLVKK